MEVVELEALDGLPFPAHPSRIVEDTARFFAGASAEAGRCRHFFTIHKVLNAIGGSTAAASTNEVLNT